MSTIRELAEALVHVYERNDWKWIGKTPTAADIEETIKSLLTTMATEEDVCEVSTGRLKVTRESEEDGGGLTISINTTVAWVERDGTLDVDVS